MRLLMAGGVLALSLTLAGCGEYYTFEAVPVGVDEDAAEEGIGGDPTKIDCFTIEADASSGDGGDEQLGTFCKRGS